MCLVSGKYFTQTVQCIISVYIYSCAGFSISPKIFLVTAISEFFVHQTAKQHRNDSHFLKTVKWRTLVRDLWRTKLWSTVTELDPS
jgi:hypothetical protein